MSFALLHTALLLPAELLLNRLLQLDPQSRQRLLPFNNKSLCIQCTSPSLTLYITVREPGLHFSVISETAPDATLSGSAGALLGLLRKGSTLHNLHGTGLSLSGSTGLASGLQAALLALDVDWEYQLSRLLGDLPTGAISTVVSSGAAAVSRTRERLHEDLHDYLTLESGLLPDPVEVEAFYHDIRQLILRADRLQAKADQFSSSH